MSTASDRRWTLATDAVLGGSVLTWVLLLALAHPPATLRVVVPLIVLVVVVHRVLVLVDRAHRQHSSAVPAAAPAVTVAADESIDAA